MATETVSFLDCFAWILNVSASVLIVFVNKELMSAKSGFIFATTLCGLHYLACSGSAWLAEAFGFSERASLPAKDAWIFALVASVSIASLNISLLVNTVGFYQIAKLLVIPFICMVEMVWMKRKFSAPVLGCIMTVMCGVGIVTVTDTTVTLPGLIVAAVSVVASGSQQILCGAYQRMFKLSSNQLLSNTAPLQGALLMMVGPFLDRAISNKWVFEYDMQTVALTWLLLSCAIAVLVNISQFMCLGRFSAVSFQVIGHSKTISILLIGWWYFKEDMHPRKALGMSLAVLGMVLYGYLSGQQKPPVTPKEEEKVPLISKEENTMTPTSVRSEALNMEQDAVRHQE